MALAEFVVKIMTHPVWINLKQLNLLQIDKGKLQMTSDNEM